MWFIKVLVVAFSAPVAAFVAPMQGRSPPSLSSSQLFESVVVISPPGGVGEVAAVKAASMGSSVKWFVVSPVESPEVVLSPEALQSIENAGGKVELAGSDPANLLLPVQDSSSSLGAVSTWCGSADAMICTFDGVEEMKGLEEGGTTAWKSAIKVAAKQASSSIRGRKIAVLPPNDDGETQMKEKDGLSKLLGVFGGSSVEIPETIAEAMGEQLSSIYSVRHGTLFGTPESSPAFSALVDGPRRFPELCEEYINRGVRVDPAVSASGNIMLGGSTRSSRLSVGEISALLALGKVDAQQGLDVCISSLSGTSPLEVEDWANEFERVSKILSSSEAFQLFAFEFSSVPSIERLTDWIATKWAPAVLRTYEIAAIRTGARPVYATKVDDNRVDVIWQQLVDFDSKTVGKMTIEVKENGVTASRGPGSVEQGYGEISRKPLNGEDVLVRQLAEAASQAVEKGLAIRIPVKVPEPRQVSPEVMKQSESTPAIVASSVSSSSSSESGPRKAGARRPTQRSRGTERSGEN